MKVKVRATGHPVARERTVRLRPKGSKRDVNSIHCDEVVEVELTAYYQARIKAGELEIVEPAQDEARKRRAKGE